MKLDEFAFVNQQLAGMLKAGIPLEGSLRQLCATMRRGQLKSELEQLEADLAKGIPLKEALAARKLPEFYVRMLQVGAQSNDLPGVLLMLADYYSKVNTIATRLKGLMVYPLIVLLTATAVSVGLAVILRALLNDMFGEFLSWGTSGTPSPEVIWVQLWLPAIFLCVISLTVATLMALPKLRRALRWRLPGFQEASLSQFAASMNLLLRGGNNLNDSLELLRQMETSKPMQSELARWQMLLAAGNGKVTALDGQTKALPPLFLWLVANSGEDLITGFGRAAEIYYARAVYRTEMLLYAALPISILLLGTLILSQVWPLLNVMRVFMDMMGSDGG